MHAVIVGNGVTGITAALRLRQLEPSWKITVVSGESKYHYSRPALMYVFMGHMRYEDTKPFEDSHWREQRIDLVRDWVTAIDVVGKRLLLHREGSLDYDRLLLATGSKSNRFGWPGQELAGVHGLWGLYDLRGLTESCQECSAAVIVGGGLIGIELAEMLHSRNIDVTFLIREDSYWGNILPREEFALVSRIIVEAGMALEVQTNLREIVGDAGGRVAAAVSEDDRRFECQIVGLTPGVSPNIDLVADSEIATGRGILVDASLRTGIPDVYAAGDCAEIRAETLPEHLRPEGGRNLLQQVWYTGKMMGEVVADVMVGSERTYDPGIWFNSAKFLDLEYQTYGLVGRKVPGENSLYWESADGRRALRLVHVAGALIGVNVMGMRYSHEVCERWLRARARVEDVVAHRLPEASFDPELFHSEVTEIVPVLQAQLAEQGLVADGSIERART